MLRWESLLAGDGVEVARVACDGHERGWSATEPVTGFGIVLVRTGLFRRQVDGTESVLDATSATSRRDIICRAFSGPAASSGWRLRRIQGTDAGRAAGRRLAGPRHAGTRPGASVAAAAAFG